MGLEKTGPVLIRVRVSFYIKGRTHVSSRRDFNECRDMAHNGGAKFNNVFRFTSLKRKMTISVGGL